MSTWLSEREERLVEGAEELEFQSPVPTQIVSNGEYLPPKQSPKQKQVEDRIKESVSYTHLRANETIRYQVLRIKE